MDAAESRRLPTGERTRRRMPVPPGGVCDATPGRRISALAPEPEEGSRSSSPAPDEPLQLCRHINALPRGRPPIDPRSPAGGDDAVRRRLAAGKGRGLPAVDRIGYRAERRHDETSSRSYADHPRRSDAGAGRAEGGIERRLRVQRLVGTPLRRGLRRGGGEAMQSRSTCSSGGRRTRSSAAAHWPLDESPMPIASTARTNTSPRRTPESLDWNNSTLLEGKVQAAVAALKEQDGPELRVYRELRSLLQTLSPAASSTSFGSGSSQWSVGRGKALFGRRPRPGRPGARGLEVLHQRSVSPPPTAHAGEVQTGSFAFEEPSEREVERREAMKAGAEHLSERSR